MGLRDLLRSLLLLTGILALCAGCGGEQSRSAAKAPAPSAAPAAAAPAAQAPPPAAAPALPPPGQVLVQATPAGVTLLANQAPRTSILDRLADALHFVVIARGTVPSGGPLTVEARELPLEEVLSRTLEGLPFQIAYDVEPESGRHVVRAVLLGSFRGLLARESRPVRGREGGLRGREERREREAPTPEELARTKEIQEQRKRAEAQIARDLESSDPATRASAVSNMRAESENLPKLSNLLLHDPAPAVRAAAAEQIGGVGTNEAVNALLRGLGDPDPQVVLSAIDALSFAGDETVVPDLKNLLQHPNPQVREAAKQAIESLE